MVPIKHANDFFRELSPELQAALQDISHERHAGAGEVLLRDGSQCSHLYQLHAGTVECRVPDGRGGVAVAASLGKGDWLGLPEAVSGLPSMADVVATTPVHLRIIAYWEFETLLDRYPLLSRRLLQLFSVSLSTFYQEAHDRSALPLRDRLLRALYTLSFSHGKTLRHQQGILIEMPQEELSQRLAAARQTLNRQLKQLEREGLIRVNYGSITVLGLHRLAERQLSQMPQARTVSEARPGVS